MFETGADQALATDVLRLQALPSVGAYDASLGRRRRHRGGGDKVNVCLISLQNLLNDLDVLNIFGGSLGL